MQTDPIPDLIDYASDYWEDCFGIADLDELVIDRISLSEIKYIFESVKPEEITGLMHNMDSSAIDYLTEIIPFLKQVEEIDIRSPTLTQEHIKQIAVHCKNLKHIRLDLHTNVLCHVLGSIHLANQNSRSFTLSNHRCQKNDTSNIFGSCITFLCFTQIIDLQLFSCEMPPILLFSTILNLSCLDRLKISNCKNIPFNFPTCLLKIRPLQKELHYNFARCNFAEHNLKNVQTNVSFLEAFVSYYNLSLDDEFLEYISIKCPILKKLCIGNPPGCDDLYAGPSAAHFDSTLNFTVEGIRYVASMESLRYFDLYGFKNDNLSVILRPLLQLKRLKLVRKDEDFSDVAIMFVKEATNLRELVILGHVVSDFGLNLRQRLRNISIKSNINFILEEGSLKAKELQEFKNSSNSFELTTCDAYCKRLREFIS